MSGKKNQKSKSDRLMSILTFLAFLLIIWEMDIFRKTFIHISIPLSLFLIGGPILFFLLRKRINYYVNAEYGLFLQTFHGTILLGGTFMFLLMALNYYLPLGKTMQFDLKVMKTGTMSSRRGCGSPYAIVDHHGFHKQLVFPCNTYLEGTKTIRVELQKGLLGFLIVKDSKLISSGNSKSDSNTKVEVDKLYNKILVKAEEYYSKGNIQKSVEIYERATRINPSDTFVKIRLKELKSNTRGN